MPSKYFLNLEKKQAQRKTLYRVKNHNQQIIDTEKGVLRVIQNFYKTLYKSQGKIDYSYLLKLQIPQISNET